MSEDNTIRTLSDKYKVGGEFNDRLRQISLSNIDEKRSVPRHKSRFGLIVWVVIVASILILAALKNPSNHEAKSEIKSLIKEKINESSADTDFMSSLAMIFVQSMLDNWLQIKVSSYIFFSTFNVTVNAHEEKISILSGIIIFGEIIPLQSELVKTDNYKAG